MRPRGRVPEMLENPDLHAYPHPDGDGWVTETKHDTGEH